jgi:hypothetical protein
MEEIKDLKEILAIAKCMRDKLLTNMMKEQQFKLDLRSTVNKEAGIELLLEQQMSTFNNIFEQMNSKLANI